jgi:two-component system sensor histidine kinase AtoS
VIDYAIERKKLFNYFLENERKLFQTEKMAAVGTLLTGMIHNLNNPLSVILGRLELLKSISKPGDSVDNFLNQIEEHVKRIRSITGDMSNIVLPQVQGYKETSIGTIIKHVERYVKNLPGNIHLDLNIEIKQDFKINCNHAEIEMALVNIINNAIEAIERKGFINLRIFMEKQQGMVEIEDNGTGMSAGVQKRIFEPFFTSKQGMAARGLGLSVAQRVVIRHHGEITVHSVEGQGTKVLIIFTKCIPDD